MKNLIIMVTLVLLTGCGAGGNSPVQLQSVSLPVVTEIAYKDIVACKEAKGFPGYSNCKIKVGKSGMVVGVRIQTANIPEKE